MCVDAVPVKSTKAVHIMCIYLNNHWPIIIYRADKCVLPNEIMQMTALEACLTDFYFEGLDKYALEL